MVPPVAGNRSITAIQKVGSSIILCLTLLEQAELTRMRLLCVQRLHEPFRNIDERPATICEPPLIRGDPLFTRRQSMPIYACAGIIHLNMSTHIHNTLRCVEVSMLITHKLLPIVREVERVTAIGTATAYHAMRVQELLCFATVPLFHSCFKRFIHCTPLTSIGTASRM